MSKLRPHTQTPQKQGLYDPRFERDACGIGMIAHVKGTPSRQIVSDALTILHNLDHRGATGSDPLSGDGAGILTQLPHRFLQAVCEHELGHPLPELGDYGVGIVFMLPEVNFVAHCKVRVAREVANAGQTLIGWRDVPTIGGCLGDVAGASQPEIKMVFIGRNTETTSREDFERQLYLIRKRTAKTVRNLELTDNEAFYISSLSSKTIIYKGMLTPLQLSEYFPDLTHPLYESALAMVHSRFSTNTFPSWARAHPYRMLMHNGEINTIQGNKNWMRAREKMMTAPHFEQLDLEDIFPIVDEEGSDSGMFDNVLEFLTLNGMPLAQAMMMMVPEPWQNHDTMDATKSAFYEYHACLMEPWDGPAALAFTDGVQIGATLDRNGLRPARYYVTNDDRVILASEVGVLDIDSADIIKKGRLEPGKMLLIDTAAGKIISDEELKATIAGQHPYEAWLKDNLMTLDDLPEPTADQLEVSADLLTAQRAFGYTFEDLRLLLAPLAKDGTEAIGSMGDDTPLAVLSERPRLLYDYFKQLFAQVTNPPIDAIREQLVTATETYLGVDGNMLEPLPENCRRLKLPHPILTNVALAKVRFVSAESMQSHTLPIFYDPLQGAEGLESALAALGTSADAAIADGATLLILSDRQPSPTQAPIPALLATSAVHHHLIQSGNRVKVSLVVESAEPREVHHFACLLGYGAEAINPYLAFESIGDVLNKQLVTGVSYAEAEQKYVKGLVKGIVKVCSKMGISTIQSYGGAQIFEALGLDSDLVAQYFSGTPSRIQGSDLTVVAAEILARHQAAFPERAGGDSALPAGGKYQVRDDGERHAYDPATVHALQNAVRQGSYKAFKRYSRGVNSAERRRHTLRGLLDFRKGVHKPVALSEVESVDEILKRFKTGAMSYGSISKEAHETLAVAMNRLGGRSNTGEGGEDVSRLTPRANGDSAKSKIKQVASGRFGVTSEYLVNAEEIQIKMAQGAKPGEGGQLPGQKVYPWIAKVRLSTPGVGLISPPPHHDIYSIEDLAQLIFDLKNANPKARINVKLVSEVGVGTIAAGVAKGHADVILISGHSGGTGAAPLTSVKNVGLPWELGLAETHQTLLLNDLRSRVRLETDGQLKTGRDVVIATLLGAEEYGFSTAPLVALGCIMMRVCHLNTCPVGIATQNPELRKQFVGKPEHIENFMRFIAEEMREIMAQLGFKTVNEMVGQTQILQPDAALAHWKADGIDLSSILYRPIGTEDAICYQTIEQDHNLEATLDSQLLLDLCAPALNKQHNHVIKATVPIRNIHRTVGTMLGHRVTETHGRNGLEEDRVQLQFHGSAGQSFGAFLPHGLTFSLVGDANDGFGKGLSGGKLSVYPPADAAFEPSENIIIGNVGLYGATTGEAYISGVAGERFAVRNSGATAVVEGVGDHGCEYMTGGIVVNIGRSGRNFAAGMSGGVAYVLDADGTLLEKANRDMVDIEPLEHEADIRTVKTLIGNHVGYTGSRLGQAILKKWGAFEPKFYRVIPRDYRRMLAAIEVAQADGLVGDSAELAAFESVV